jgi:hypothetical protein
MTHQAGHAIATVTRNHSIEVVNDHLIIRGSQETLTPDETEQLLNVLLIWRYGLEAVSVDELEDLPNHKLDKKISERFNLWS